MLSSLPEAAILFYYKGKVVVRNNLIYSSVPVTGFGQICITGAGSDELEYALVEGNRIEWALASSATTGSANTLVYIAANESLVRNNTILATKSTTNDVLLWVRAVYAGSKQAIIKDNIVVGGGTSYHGSGLILVNGLSGTASWSQEVMIIGNSLRNALRGVSVAASTFSSSTEWTQHSNSAISVSTVEEDFGETVPAKRITGSSGSVSAFTGVGSPESSAIAPIGSTYLRRDGASGTSFYVKESGTGNTGWIAK